MGENFLASLREVNADEVAIYLRAQGDGEPLDEREHQALLTLVKGNIN